MQTIMIEDENIHVLKSTELPPLHAREQSNAVCGTIQQATRTSCQSHL
jgi:hypothetical protein